jgi:hypothetical protein
LKKGAVEISSYFIGPLIQARTSWACHKYLNDLKQKREPGSAMMATDEGGATAEIERLKQECQEMKDAIKHAGLYMWPYEKGMNEGGRGGGGHLQSWHRRKSTRYRGTEENPLVIAVQKKIHLLSWY